MKQLDLKNNCTYIFSYKDNPKSYQVDVALAVALIIREVGDNVHENICLNTKQTMWEAQYCKIKRKGLKKLIHLLSQYIIRKTAL